MLRGHSRRPPVCGAVHAWPLLSRGNRIEHTAAAVPGGYLLGGRREQRRRLRSAAVARAAATAGTDCTAAELAAAERRRTTAGICRRLLSPWMSRRQPDLRHRAGGVRHGPLVGQAAKGTPRGCSGVATPRRGQGREGPGSAGGCRPPADSIPRGDRAAEPRGGEARRRGGERGDPEESAGRRARCRACGRLYTGGAPLPDAL